MKKVDITIKIANLNQWEAEKFYIRLCHGINPIHPTGVEELKKQIESQLGYIPEIKY